MELSRARIALDKLARPVAKVLRLNEVRRTPALAEDRDYQRVFTGYYRMGRRRLEFYTAFFAMLQHAASGRAPLSLYLFLQELYDRTQQRHLSFCSKLLATVDDSAVVYDRNVACFFGVPCSRLPKNGRWLDEAVRRYELIRKGVLDFTKAPEWVQMRDLFDKRFPEAAHLSNIRKADLIIWASHDS